MGSLADALRKHDAIESRLTAPVRANVCSTSRRDRSRERLRAVVHGRRVGASGSVLGVDISDAAPGARAREAQRDAISHLRRVANAEAPNERANRSMLHRPMGIDGHALPDDGPASVVLSCSGWNPSVSPGPCWRDVCSSISGCPDLGSPGKISATQQLLAHRARDHHRPVEHVEEIDVPGHRSGPASASRRGFGTSASCRSRRRCPQSNEPTTKPTRPRSRVTSHQRCFVCGVTRVVVARSMGRGGRMIVASRPRCGVRPRDGNVTQHRCEAERGIAPSRRRMRGPKPLSMTSRHLTLIPLAIGSRRLAPTMTMVPVECRRHGARCGGAPPARGGAARAGAAGAAGAAGTSADNDVINPDAGLAATDDSRPRGFGAAGGNFGGLEGAQTRCAVTSWRRRWGRATARGGAFLSTNDVNAVCHRIGTWAPRRRSVHRDCSFRCSSERALPSRLRLARRKRTRSRPASMTSSRVRIRHWTGYPRPKLPGVGPRI